MTLLELVRSLTEDHGIADADILAIRPAKYGHPHGVQLDAVDFDRLVDGRTCTVMLHHGQELHACLLFPDVELSTVKAGPVKAGPQQYVAGVPRG